MIATTAMTTDAAQATPEALRARPIDTPLGSMVLIGTERGLRAILWPDEDARYDTVPDDGVAVLVEAERQLGEYFDGRRQVFDLPLDLVGTEFQVTAWRALASVPFGATATYGEQARRLGRPTATRAVGAANGRNPVPIVLPCHRIVGADGSLTGFAGGLDAKRWLLDHEQRDRLF